MNSSIEISNFKEAEKVPNICDKPGEIFDALLKEHKLSDEEYKTLKNILGRAPTMSELGVFSAMWSEHCSYKSSKVHLGRFPTEGEHVVLGPGENAGVIRLSNKLCAVFKMESHNHPSYIEPFQGAATGVGGILRDVFCMGARPIANLNALRFGAKDHKKTSWLLTNAVKGIGDYGNCIGVPTVGGNLSFDKSYNGNCLVNAMTVGLIHEDRIFKGFASGIGNLVVYVGSATGRDGIHGATMASDSFESSEESERSAIQVGDPFMEKLLLEATLEVLDKDLVVGIQDMGAAGLTSSSFEMADRAQTGLLLDLSKVPQRTTKMSAYELLLSESQERMLMVIKPEKWTELAVVLERWQLHYAVIGKVTDTGKMQALFDGKIELDVPIAPLAASAPKYNRPIRKRTYPNLDTNFDAKVTAKIDEIGTDKFLAMILERDGSKKDVFRQYDQHIGTKTHLASKEGGAAVQWLQSEHQDKNEPYLGVLSVASCNERYCRMDPKKGASFAVVKSARMISAAGGTPIAATDCLNYGNPEDPEVMWDFAEGVDGITVACIELNTPIVSGNVSFYNETDGKSIAPTPMIGMVGKIKDVRKSIASEFSESGTAYLFKPKNKSPKFGGSLASQLLEFDDLDGEIPDLDFKIELESMDFLRQCSEKSLLTASRDVGAGGYLPLVYKMARSYSLEIKIKDKSQNRLLFAEWAGAYVLASNEKNKAELIKEAGNLENYELIEVADLKLNEQELKSNSKIIFDSYDKSLRF